MQSACEPAKSQIELPPTPRRARAATLSPWQAGVTQGDTRAFGIGKRRIIRNQLNGNRVAGPLGLHTLRNSDHSFWQCTVFGRHTMPQ